MKRIRCLKCNDIIEGDKQGTLINVNVELVL